MRDIVLFTGAGASFGAGGTLPSQPPLGARLYEDLVATFPGSWGRLPLDVAESFANRGFEAGMAEVESRFYGAVPHLMREMAVYFLGFRIVGPNLLQSTLSLFVGRGFAERLVVSTLNYELLLEQAINRLGHVVDYGMEGTGIPVLKLHGSANFFCAGLQAGPGISYGKGIVWEGGVRALGNVDEAIRHCLAETALAPVMSLYMRGKPLAVSPSAVQTIQTKWRGVVASAQTILCIGVRPRPEDDHIWDALSSTSAKIVAIGAKDEFEAWAAASRPSGVTVLGNRFDEAFPMLKEEIARWK